MLTSVFALMELNSSSGTFRSSSTYLVGKITISCPLSLNMPFLNLEGISGRNIAFEVELNLAVSLIYHFTCIGYKLPPCDPRALRANNGCLDESIAIGRLEKKRYKQRSYQDWQYVHVRILEKIIYGAPCERFPAWHCANTFQCQYYQRPRQRWKSPLWLCGHSACGMSVSCRDPLLACERDSANACIRVYMSPARTSDAKDLVMHVAHKSHFSVD